MISVNPRAGAKSAIERVHPVQRALEGQGYRVQVSTDLAEVASTAQAWHASGELRAVLAAGGDGTASAVRNAITADVPLLPLPFGTECLLARHVGQTADPAAICKTVECGLTVPLDLGKIGGKIGDKAGDRYFMLMMSVGVDAEVVHRLQSQRTGHITHAAYVKPTFETLRKYKYPELRVIDGSGSDETWPCRWLFGFNLPCYARGLQFAPDADCADGLLDVCRFERGQLYHSLKYLWHVSRGSHRRLRDASFARLGKFRVEAVGGESVAVQVDGDRAGTLPVDVEVVPGGLTLMVPPAGAQRLGFRVPKDVVDLGRQW